MRNPIEQQAMWLVGYFILQQRKLTIIFRFINKPIEQINQLISDNFCQFILHSFILNNLRCNMIRTNYSEIDPLFYQRLGPLRRTQCYNIEKLTIGRKGRRYILMGIAFAKALQSNKNNNNCNGIGRCSMGPLSRSVYILFVIYYI